MSSNAMQNVAHGASTNVSGGLLKTKAAANYLGTSPRRLAELTKSGQIAALRDGGCLKYAVTELERYVADLPAYEPANW